MTAAIPIGEIEQTFRNYDTHGYVKVSPPNPTPHWVLDAVWSVTGVSREEMMSHRRHHKTVEARYAAIWLMRERLGMTFSEIGRLMDRDHSTILYAFGRAEAKILSRDTRMCDIVGSVTVGAPTL